MIPPLRLVFAGTPEFAVPHLAACRRAGIDVVAVYTQPDRPAGRGRALQASPVKARAEELQLPVIQPTSLKATEAAAQLASFRPDLMVVVAYGLILPKAILETPRFGCLNIHASLLPRWRGAAPIQRAILAGDARTGITIMQMDTGLDTGPVLLERPVAIGAHETAGQLHDRLARLGAACVVEAIDGWRSGRLVATAQPASGATYAAKLRKEEAFIDWGASAAEIERRVRAFNPWPVAETRWRGAQLRIWDATAVPLAAPLPPGTVLGVGAGEVVVATGEGALRLETLQLPGRRPTPAAEFLRAHALGGERLGQADG